MLSLVKKLITGHVIYNLACTYKFQLKTTQVFIPNTEKIEESIKQFVEMYSLRTRKSLEYWLVDIKYWTANVDDRTSFYERIRHDLRNLHLDLDDDLYFFEGKNSLSHLLLRLFVLKFQPF